MLRKTSSEQMKTIGNEINPYENDGSESKDSPYYTPTVMFESSSMLGKLLSLPLYSSYERKGR